MGEKELGTVGLDNVWKKVFGLTKLITGNVDVKQKGNLQTQINNIQANINKVFGDEDNPDGGIGFVEGIEADNIIDAINEVFQLGNEKKNKLVENLVAMGINASTDDTWEELLNKVLDMTDTSKDTVNENVLLAEYTAHSAEGELITGIMPERASVTVDTTGVTQDSSYTYFGVPAGHYDENSKVRAINSDLSSGIYYIGTGTNFDLKSKFPDDYSKFTIDNFIVVPTVNAGTSGNQGQYTGGYGQTYYASNTKLSLTKTYTNGVISISASLKITASATSRSYDVDYPRSKDYSPSISCAVYLVVGEIKNL